MLILSVNSLSIIGQAFAQSDSLGKLIFAALFTLSIISWIVLLTKTIHLKRLRQLSDQLEGAILRQKERLLEVPSERLKGRHPFAHIYENFKIKTVEILNKNHHFATGNTVFLSRSDVDLIESAVIASINNEAKDLEHNLFILSTVVTLAPFLGLLGTVWGILLTFSQMQSASSAFSNQVVLGGLAMALATTVLGLVIAIPALIGYNYLKNGIKHFFAEMEGFGEKLLSTVELQYRKVE